jgi:hypothetical protein
MFEFSFGANGSSAVELEGQKYRILSELDGKPSTTLGQKNPPLGTKHFLKF